MKDKLIFIGNSIVNGFPFSRGKSFPGLIRATVRDGTAGFSYDIINKGINGQTTEEILQRFDQDVISHDPTAVFILTGTNDFIFHCTDSAQEETFSANSGIGERQSGSEDSAGGSEPGTTHLENLVRKAFTNLETMAEKAEADGIIPVYLTPLPVDAALAKHEWMVGLGINYDQVNHCIGQLCEMIRKGNRLFIDTHIAYKRYADNLEERPCPRAYVDGIHPTAEGYNCLAEEISHWIKNNINHLSARRTHETQKRT